MFHGDVVDQLLDDNSLADAGATKCADFAAFCKWANKIDDLDPSFQDLCTCVLLNEGRRWRDGLGNAWCSSPRLGYQSRRQ